jgi:bacterioferritin-associated ferredoxin
VLVCHCNVVTDREIVATIEAGACDRVQVAAACGAGRDCEGCVPTVEALLADAGLAVRSPGALRAAQRVRRSRVPARVPAA